MSKVQEPRECESIGRKGFRRLQVLFCRWLDLQIFLFDIDGVLCLLGAAQAELVSSLWDTSHEQKDSLELCHSSYVMRSWYNDNCLCLLCERQCARHMTKVIYRSPPIRSGFRLNVPPTLYNSVESSWTGSIYQFWRSTMVEDSIVKDNGKLPLSFPH